MSETPTRPVVGRAQGRVMSAGRRAIRLFGEATAAWRPDPEFLVIGAKRGGSTSFFFDLARHPQVVPLFPRPDHLPKATQTKGIHYFDQNYGEGERWYRSHLPSTRARARQARRAGGPVITGEASPYYLFHPHAPERAAALLPDAKLIAVLRDPVERAYSHWKERRRAGAEPLEFAAALDAEDERLAGVDDASLADPSAYSYAHEQQTYVRQSEYDVCLERWLAVYPREQLLVLASEDYYADPQGVLDEAFAFLGLPSAPAGKGEALNAAAGSALDDATRAGLTAHFAPHNARLADLLGRSFPWS